MNALIFRLAFICHLQKQRKEEAYLEGKEGKENQFALYEYTMYKDVGSKGGVADGLKDLPRGVHSFREKFAWLERIHRPLLHDLRPLRLRLCHTDYHGSNTLIHSPITLILCLP